MSASFSKSTEPLATVLDGAPQDLGSANREASCELLPGARLTRLTEERLLAAEALRLLIRLDRDLLEARAQWNQDWFRRIMRIRPKAVLRMRRRWAKLDPKPAIPLGSLRRRYHANLAGYLYEPKP